MNGLFFTDEINECLDSKAFIAHVAPVSDELDLFAKLSDGGNVTMPLQDTFWGAYFGMWTDRFGVNWMVNYDDPDKTQQH